MQPPFDPSLELVSSIEYPSDGPSLSALDAVQLPPPSRPGSNRLSQALAIQLDEHSESVIALRNVWEQLTQGYARATDSFSTGTRHYLVLELRPLDSPFEDRPRRLHIEALKSYFLGTRQKVLAMNWGRRHSTVTTGLGGCLGLMGFEPRATRAPALLAAAAIASSGNARIVHARLTPLLRAETHLAIVSIPRLEQRYAGVLSDAELDIVRCLVDRDSYVEIATKRKTKVRTVANQVASVFRKLQVSGHTELFLKLICGALEPNHGSASAQ